jgi:hypothetical protein
MAVMNRNALYALIGVLVIAAAVLGYQLYQEQHKTSGIEITIGKTGVSVDQK